MKDMENLQLTDEIVFPVMGKFGIGRDEAEKRLRLLFQSEVLQQGQPEDVEQQRLIDDFLSYDSDTLAEKVAFEKCLNECIENKDFVKQYDRLSGRNLTRLLRLLKNGETPPDNTEKEIRKFSEFVRKTVFAAWVNPSNELTPEK